MNYTVMSKQPGLKTTKPKSTKILMRVHKLGVGKGTTTKIHATALDSVSYLHENRSTEKKDFHYRGRGSNK